MFKLTKSENHTFIIKKMGRIEFLFYLGNFNKNAFELQTPCSQNHAISEFVKSYFGANHGCV